MDSDASFDFRRITADGHDAPVERAVAREVPVAIEFNGIGYAVLMTSPSDLLDLAYGFALAERLIAQATDDERGDDDHRDVAEAL